MRGTDDLVDWARGAVSKTWKVAKTKVSRRPSESLPTGMQADRKKKRTLRLKSSLKKATCLCMPTVV